MKKLHIIISLLLLSSTLIKGMEVKWECMKNYYDEIALPHIVDKCEYFVKTVHEGNLLKLHGGNDLKYAEKLSFYSAKKDIYMPLIRAYNKAWHERRNHQYEQAAITLKELLENPYFEATPTSFLGYRAACYLMYIESYQGKENHLLSQKACIRVREGRNADALKLASGDSFFRSLLPNLNRSYFSNKCYSMFVEFHKEATTLKEVSEKINLIEDALEKKFCMYLFYYFYEIGYDINIVEGIELARKIDEAEAYFIIASVIFSLDGLISNYDVWLAQNLLYAQAAKKGYLSAVYIFDNLPPMSKSEEKEMMQKLWDIWDAYPEQDKKREQ